MKMSSPKTWSRFTRTMNGAETKFRIQEVTADKYEEILELYMKYHTPEEPLRVISGVSNNAKALQEFKNIMLEMMVQEKQHILVCCLDDDSEDLKYIGASKMALVERNALKRDYDYKIKTKEVQDFVKIREALYAEYNVLNEYNLVNSYLADRGLVVDPTYRGLGIAEELLKVRVEVCQVNNISLYTAMATVVGSQKIAEKLGAKTVRELDLEEYARNAGLPFTGAPITVKLIVGRIPV